VNANEQDGAGAQRPAVNGSDLVVSALVLAGCGFVYWRTTGFEEVSSLLGDGMSPQAFPRLILGVIAVLALILPFEHRFNRAGVEGIDRVRRERVDLMTVVTAVFLVLVVLSIKWVGTLASMMVVALVLPMMWGEWRIRLVIPYAMIFVGLVTVLFAYGLGVHFEPGAMGWGVR